MAATLASIVTSGAAAEGQEIVVSQSGSIASAKGTPDNFTGHVIIDLLTPSTLNTPASSGLVTFSPGGRTGQMLIVTSGKGWVQKEGQARKVIHTGDVIWIPAGVKHWHGATDSTGMSHIAVTYLQNGKGAEWLEPVTDQQYSNK